MADIDLGAAMTVSKGENKWLPLQWTKWTTAVQVENSTGTKENKVKGPVVVSTSLEENSSDKRHYTRNA